MVNLRKKAKLGVKAAAMFGNYNKFGSSKANPFSSTKNNK